MPPAQGKLVCQVNRFRRYLSLCLFCYLSRLFSAKFLAVADMHSSTDLRHFWRALCSDRQAAPLPMDSKWRSIRSASGATPVNR